MPEGSITYLLCDISMYIILSYECIHINRYYTDNTHTRRRQLLMSSTLDETLTMHHCLIRCLMSSAPTDSTLATAILIASP